MSVLFLLTFVRRVAVDKFLQALSVFVISARTPSKLWFSFMTAVLTVSSFVPTIA